MEHVLEFVLLNGVQTIFDSNGLHQRNQGGIEIDINSPAGAGLNVTDDSFLPVFERTTHVSQVEITIHLGHCCCWYRF